MSRYNEGYDDGYRAGMQKIREVKREALYDLVKMDMFKASSKLEGIDYDKEREWVGLTGDERSYVRSEYLRGAIGILGVCDFCEAKLKEKNTP
jgi:hypothetical protein